MRSSGARLGKKGSAGEKGAGEVREKERRKKKVRKGKEKRIRWRGPIAKREGGGRT